MATLTVTRAEAPQAADVDPAVATTARILHQILGEQEGADEFVCTVSPSNTVDTLGVEDGRVGVLVTMRDGTKCRFATHFHFHDDEAEVRSVLVKAMEHVQTGDVQEVV